MKKFPKLGAFAVCFAIGCTPMAFADDDAAVEEAVETVEKVEEKVKKLGIGSIAPTLDVEYWLDDSKEPVSEFASDQVYVVEFWATWCGPCLYSMPHLAELQSKYADQGVRMISISREDLETVTEFLDKPVNPSILKAAKKNLAADQEASEEEAEAEPITYGQLTASYSLTTDPDASSSNDYMKAANQNGIPCAFIVGKDGHIEWIGHPMSMDEPLAKVVAGDWDREAAKIEFALSEERTLKYRQIAMADRAGKYEKVMELLTETKELFAGSVYEPTLTGMKFKAALQSKQTESVLAEVERMTQRDGNDYAAINGWAWDVYSVVSEGYPNDEEIVAMTMNALENAVTSVKDKEAELADTLWPAYDTLAHLKAHAGDKEAAIAWQTKAIELAPEEKVESMQAYLDELTGKNDEKAEGTEKTEAKKDK